MNKLLSDTRYQAVLLEKVEVGQSIEEKGLWRENVLEYQTAYL